MKRLLKKCGFCKVYTLVQKCERCGNRTQDAYPARFSPDDKYIRYRIAARYIEKQ